jgi:hypothetical protein
MTEPIEAQSNGVTEKEEQKQKTRKQINNSISYQSIAPVPGWEPITKVWKKYLSGSPQAKDQPIFKRLINSHGVEKVCMHLTNYLLSHKDADRAAYISMDKFESTFGAYAKPDKKNQTAQHRELIKSRLEARYGPDTTPSVRMPSPT